MFSRSRNPYSTIEDVVHRIVSTAVYHYFNYTIPGRVPRHIPLMMFLGVSLSFVTLAASSPEAMREEAVVFLSRELFLMLAWLCSRFFFSFCLFFSHFFCQFIFLISSFVTLHYVSLLSRYSKRMLPFICSRHGYSNDPTIGGGGEGGTH